MCLLNEACCSDVVWLFSRDHIRFSRCTWVHMCSARGQIQQVEIKIKSDKKNLPTKPEKHHKKNFVVNQSAFIAWNDKPDMLIIYDLCIAYTHVHTESSANKCETPVVSSAHTRYFYSKSMKLINFTAMLSSITSLPVSHVNFGYSPVHQHHTKVWWDSRGSTLSLDSLIHIETGHYRIQRW